MNVLLKCGSYICQVKGNLFLHTHIYRYMKSQNEKDKGTFVGEELTWRPRLNWQKLKTYKTTTKFHESVTNRHAF